MTNFCVPFKSLDGAPLSDEQLSMVCQITRNPGIIQGEGGPEVKLGDEEFDTVKPQLAAIGIDLETDRADAVADNREIFEWEDLPDEL